MPRQHGDLWQIPESSRNRAAALIKLGTMPLHAIAADVGISNTTAHEIRTYIRLFGVPHNPYRLKPGPKRKITPEILFDLKHFLAEDPCAYLDEIAWYLYDTWDIAVSEPTISKVLKEEGYTWKKCRKAAAERNPEDRRVWEEDIMPQLHQEELVFIDESGANERTGDRKYG